MERRSAAADNGMMALSPEKSVIRLDIDGR
jgi:hypothetical protein